MLEFGQSQSSLIFKSNISDLPIENVAPPLSKKENVLFLKKLKLFFVPLWDKVSEILKLPKLFAVSLKFLKHYFSKLYRERENCLTQEKQN